MRKYGIIATAVLMMTLLASFLGTANAQTYTPGVAVGNVFKYHYNLTTNVTVTNSNISSSIFDSIQELARSIDWIQMTITGVSGSIVNAQMITQYKNGTQQTYNGVTDVSTGQGELAQFLVAANLTANSPIHLNRNETINGTTTRTYPSGVREVNYQNFSMEYNVPAEDLAQYNITVPLKEVNTQQVDWDKLTGSLIEMTYHMSTQSTEVNADIILNVKLIESNVFTIPEYPALIVIMLLLIIPAFVAVKYRKKTFK